MCNYVSDIKSYSVYLSLIVFWFISFYICCEHSTYFRHRQLSASHYNIVTQWFQPVTEDKHGSYFLLVPLH